MRAELLRVNVLFAPWRVAAGRGVGGGDSSRRPHVWLTISESRRRPPPSCRKSHHASALKLIRFHPRHLARPPARPPLGADASHGTSNSAASVIRMTSHASAGSFRAVAPNVKERPQGFFFFFLLLFPPCEPNSGGPCWSAARWNAEASFRPARRGLWSGREGGREGRSSALPASLRTHPEAVLILNNALCLLLARKHA